MPRVPHTAWWGEKKVQTAAPTDLSTFSTFSTLSPGPAPAQALSSSVNSPHGGLAEVFLSISPAVSSGAQTSCTKASLLLQLLPLEVSGLALPWAVGQEPAEPLALQLLEMFQVCAMLELGSAPTLQSEQLKGNSPFPKGIHSVTG